jgi:very-short-patch-repair endonuclease
MGVSSRGEWGENQAWPDRAIGELAARQATIVTHAQLRALGVRPRTIAAAVARGRLHRVHYGVFSLVPAAARPARSAEWAGALACGPTAVLAGHSAARLHGLRTAAISEVELIVVRSERGRGRPGLRVHRTMALDRAELVRVGGLPVTSIARTVVDLAPHLHDRALEHLVDQAIARTGRTKLLETLDRHVARRGTRRLRRLLHPARPSSETWSRAEERLLGLIRRAGLPAPEVNVALGRYVPDLLWREQRVIVEFDSYAHHSGPGSFDRDRTRHNELTAQGYHVIHVTWLQLTERPERVLVWIAVALHRSPAGV